MIRDFVKTECPQEEELRERLMTARNRLFALQMKLKEHNLPVLVLMEGYGSAGKGSIIGKVIKNIDPRFFKVFSMEKITEEEKRKPFLYRYVTKIPEKGKFVFLDGGWMEEITREQVQGNYKKQEYAKRVQSVKRMERQLTDDGYLVMKFFFTISEKEQKKRLNDLLADKNTKWRVSDYDLWQNKHYEKCQQVFDRYLEETNTSTAPWYLVDSKHKKWAELQVLEHLVEGIETAMENQKVSVPILQNIFPLKKMPKLAEVPLDKTIDQEAYRKELDSLQKRLGELHNELYRKKIPVIIAYEGQDAAGKGGNIKRISEALDPRGYEVHPIASPEPHEKARHYLWRFFNRLPKSGHVAIFDRTWYGRVLVERLEGFCLENDWKRAYNEINEFEKELCDWGAILIKFWVQIDKDTQLERFHLRENTPEKQWKITEEDWRNREKWDQYEKAVDEMIEKTSTEFAPWHILESNDKRYARIQALEIVIQEIEKHL
ncbi:MAG: polyphosphate:AMP phosphotransferase [Lachnospiraceae bacterium]|nr:polyphosphate:AMP phosphotransferase [Lachnospiraceae bacterium]